ncbi:MAG: DUF2795 domain-containing protein [Streptomyces sp.]|nr:DUF2795 domain-containing protein [Streptomyces sp.]
MTITHGRDKTSPIRDDEIKREMAGELRAARGTRVEEDHELQPSGEDQPIAAAAPGAPPTRGTPPGITPEGVEMRAEMARFLGRGAFPAKRDGVVATLRRNHAEEWLIDAAERLPGDREYENMQSVSRELGFGAERAGG